MSRQSTKTAPQRWTGEQLTLPLPDAAPTAGERYRRNGTETVVAVLAVEQARQRWVTIRSAGRETTIPLAQFLRSFTRL